MDEHLTTRDAAKIIGCSTETIRRHQRRTRDSGQGSAKNSVRRADALRIGQNIGRHYDALQDAQDIATRRGN
jgi:hypothetical protein